MAVEKVICHDTAPAASDLSSKQYTLVKFDGSGNLTPAVAGDLSFPLQDNPTSGHYGTFGVVGLSKVVLGGTVAAGGALSSDANGKAVAATVASGAFTTAVVGIALQAGVSGDLIRMLITPQPV
jgi:hypothetical protein